MISRNKLSTTHIFSMIATCLACLSFTKDCSKDSNATAADYAALKQHVIDVDRRLERIEIKLDKVIEKEQN